MPLPVDYARPNLPYAPKQSLANNTRFKQITSQKSPPTAEMLDAEFNNLIDLVNTLAAAVNGVAAGNIPGSNEVVNANRFLLTDGRGNLSFSFVNNANINSNAITTDKIQDLNVTTAKIQIQAVGTDQIHGDSITETKLVDGAVTNDKIANNTIRLKKLYSSGYSCLVIGDNANYTYTELPVATNYYVPTRIVNETKPSMQPLSVVWNNSADGFSGNKILADSIDGSSAIKSNSTPLSTMKSTGTTSSVICGRTTDQKFTEVTLGNLQVITKTTNATSPSAQNLSTIFNNEGGTPYDGSQLSQNSIPANRLLNSGQITPFAMGYVLGNGNIQKQINLTSITRTKAGYYQVRLNTQANDNKYIVVFGLQDAGAVSFVTANIAQNTRAVNGFDVETGSGVTLIDSEFNFVVYSF
jgi:hypothetical protein